MRKSPFEDHFEKYEDWFKKNDWAYRSELAAIKEQLPKYGCGIEVGVGSGRFAAPLGIKIGIDPSFSMAKLAKNRGVEVLEAFAENLPFSNSSFDFVLMVTTICFVDDIEAAFKEAYRVLKPDGKLILGFVDKESFLGKKYQQNKDKSVFYKDATFYSTYEVLEHLKKTGFKKFIFRQTLFKNLSEIKNIEVARNGYGKGAFVVIKAKKGRKIMKFFIGILVGAILGSLMGHYGKCHSGVCPLTSTPLRGAIYGAFLGLIFVTM